jgi:hypothetical protein
MKGKKKGTKLGQKGSKHSINIGGQLILAIAIWKIIKKVKKTLPQNMNYRSYDG